MNRLKNYERLTDAEYKRILIKLLEEYTLKEIAKQTGRSILWLREILND